MKRRTERKALAGIAALAVAVCGPACAYDTGSLTCQMIGELAAQTLTAKQSGKPQATTLAALTVPLAEDARVERRLVGNIVETIYSNDLLIAMKPADAYSVFLFDCLNGKRDDRR